ncbi:glycosyltransferase family 2 protein [Jannaschia sp. 2305UL9-9]|uniref:glycosyltransferase family 2 protein n=1 Tax=Jannaschia sp. 2305UL9-9 TaxID=3121638 RepID=UPI003528681A
MIEERSLGADTVEGVRILDVLDEGAREDGTRDVRLFLGRGVAPDRIVARSGLRPVSITSVGKSLMVRGIWDGRGDSVPVPLDGAQDAVVAVQPEPELFARLNVAMATRNGETPETVAAWLTHHARHHGMEAALILDRRRPDEAPLAPALRRLLDRGVAGLQRVVVVSAPHPLGARKPSERHVYGAPDSPGKDRMEVPANDPWTAPLADLIVLEALRWRFLTLARGVVWLDLCDMLAPAASGHRVFDKLEQADAGVIPLIGRRVYPWRVRKGQQPAFGDHVCDLFDEAGGHRRWACAPSRIPADAPFRMVRIGNLQPEPRHAVYFYRAMALRVTEGGDLPLAPKAGLILDDDLLRLSKGVFAHNPVLPPISEGAGGKLPASVPGRTAIVTCMRNEGPYILDWIAHHRAIGVDDFLVYTNDCTDGTDTLLDLLQDAGVLQHRENPFRQTDMKPQHAALAAAEDEAIMARAGWAICMDVDEYLNIHAGEGTLRDLYAAVGDANMISVTWRLFGNDDLDQFADQPVTERFSRCAPHLIRKPHQAWGFKTLFRNIGLYKKMGVHRPKGLKPDLWEQISWVNGSGRPMPNEMLRSGWRSTTETYGYDLVTLNHYAVRDAESFLVKRDRGRVNHVDRDQGLGYWFRMNNNAEIDTSIQRRAVATGAERDRLTALPGVAAQHDACVAAHRAKIAELKQARAFAAFYDSITSDRMKRLSRMHAHFGANVFLAGPDCVPDDIAGSTPPKDFFFTVEDVDDASH